MYKKVLIVFLTITMMLSFASMALAKKVTVRFFTGKTETVKLMNQLIAEFNQENPDITVVQEFQKDASNAIKMKFASGDIPDITTVVPQDFIDQGMYVDLSDWDVWSRIDPSIKDLCTDIKTGKQFKIATNITMAGVFYNKAIFKELGLSEPKTWDEFKTDLETIKQEKPDVTPMFMAGRDSWTLGHLIEFLAHGIIKQNLGIVGARKAFIYNDQDKLNFADPDGPIAILGKRILELKNEKLFNDDFLTATYDNQLEAFANGKAAVISQGMWALSGILQKNPAMKNQIGFCPFPPIKEGTKPVILSAEDSVYAITSASKHQEAAKKFLSFLFEKENMKTYSEFVKSPSAFKDVDADWSVISGEVKDALNNGAHIAFTEWPSGFSGDDAGRMVQQLYDGQYKTPLEFAKAYQEAWDRAWKAANR